MFKLNENEIMDLQIIIEPKLQFSLVPEIKVKIEIANDLLNAIKENQLKVYYQPIIELSSNRILSAEALVRWEHPTIGIIYPNDFIPNAEENGSIIKMGKWMIDEVCFHYREWKNLGLTDIKISINYSVIQFFQDDIVEDIKNAVKKYGLEANFLVVEITERVTIDDYNHMVLNIEKLHALGVQIALDDFGTGFASLEYLSKLKLDILKLDRCFIKSILENETNNIIIKNTLNMAKELNLNVIAEGIETWEQLALLTKYNCYAGQGYIFSRPVPNEDFRKIISLEKCFPYADGSRVRFIEKRKYFRVKLPLLLEADISIINFNGRNIQTGSTPVLIENLGGGGLCFISNLLLPTQQNIILQFITSLAGTEIIVFGSPVWVNKIENDLYKYGICFKLDEHDRTNLIGVLNQFQVRLKRNKGVLDGNFILEPAVSYFSNIS